MASLLGIAIRLADSRKMQELTTGSISVESGLEGDKRSRPGRRQVTLMSLSDWQLACEEVGVSLHWTTRRANLLVDELPLCETTGKLLQLGDVVLEITGETDPCAKMETACPGLYQALKPRWRGGVTCRVISGGNFRCGDSVLVKA